MEKNNSLRESTQLAEMLEKYLQIMELSRKMLQGITEKMTQQDHQKEQSPDQPQECDKPSDSAEISPMEEYISGFTDKKRVDFFTRANDIAQFSTGNIKHFHSVTFDKNAIRLFVDGSEKVFIAITSREHAENIMLLSGCKNALKTFQHFFGDPRIKYIELDREHVFLIDGNNVVLYQISDTNYLQYIIFGETATVNVYSKVYSVFGCAPSRVIISPGDKLVIVLANAPQVTVTSKVAVEYLTRGSSIQQVRKRGYVARLATKNNAISYLINDEKDNIVLFDSELRELSGATLPDVNFISQALFTSTAIIDMSGSHKLTEVCKLLLNITEKNVSASYIPSYGIYISVNDKLVLYIEHEGIARTIMYYVKNSKYPFPNKSDGIKSLELFPCIDNQSNGRDKIYALRNGNKPMASKLFSEEFLQIAW